MAWFDMPWLAQVGLGQAWQGLSTAVSASRAFTEADSFTRPGKLWRGKHRQGASRRGRAWRTGAWCDMG